MKRVRKLAEHVGAARLQEAAAENLMGINEGEAAVPAGEMAADMSSPPYAWAKELPGEIWERWGGDIRLAEAALAETGSLFSGDQQSHVEAMARKYETNFTIARKTAGWGRELQVEPWLVVVDPDDVQQIARMHTKKAAAYQPTFMGEGIFGQNDEKEWRMQRSHLTVGFMPLTCLRQHFETIRNDAGQFCELLGQLSQDGTEALEVNDMFSHRTLCTLGKTLLNSYDILQEHSAGIRWAMTWNLSGFMSMDSEHVGRGGAFPDGAVGGAGERKYAKSLGVIDGTAAPGSPEEAQQVRSFIDMVSAKCIAWSKDSGLGSDGVAEMGPGIDDLPAIRPGALMSLAAELDTMTRAHEYDHDFATPTGLSHIEQSQIDTVSSLIFAGHDTTANTLTWACYELAKRPDVQQKLRDELAGVLGEGWDTSQLQHSLLHKLPYLTRILHETLRHRPVVHYGSLRELERDVKVKGPHGKVTVPAGTQVQLGAGILHHSEALWGPTASQWDPDRDFDASELWAEGEVFMGWNPGKGSKRFAPFASAPRQCLGMNYAQLVMRATLVSIVRRFDITLSSQTAQVAPDRVAVPRPLLKPREGMWLHFNPRADTESKA